MNVQNDAQLSMMRVIRPTPNFEALYQGSPSTNPIAFPGTLDPNAGKPGYAPNLLAGISTPLGSRVLLQFPMVIDQYASQPNYAYQIMWRVRNQSSFLSDIEQNRQGAGYHLPSEELGRKEIATATNNLIFIPGASDIEIFDGTEPSVVPASLNMRQQLYIPQVVNSWVQPIIAPGGTVGVWQQGAYQFTSDENCAGPTWFPLWLDASGDEMMILVYKTDASGNWDFAGADKGFSNTYGNNDSGLPNNPNIGILLSTGTMGS